MKAKKIPYYLLMGTLTLGASLTLGFLSLTGAMAIWPTLSVGVLFFGLSVIYEGEIYLQNIKGALNKLYFQKDYTKRQLARAFLTDHLPEQITAEHPAFLRDYSQLLQLARQVSAQPSTAANRKHLRAIQNNIQQSEKYFCDGLFPPKGQEPSLSSYDASLLAWLQEQGAPKTQAQLANRHRQYRLAMAFSAICGALMALATVYLMSGALLTLPFVAAVPFAALAALIVLASVLAGAAYACLTYNSITDMIHNDTLNRWYQRMKRDLVTKPDVRALAMAAVAVVLTGLAVVLTVFTAGTWWTIVKESPALFQWMKRIPTFFSKLVMPFFLGLSALVFNLENSAESMDFIDDMAQQSPQQPGKWLRARWAMLMQTWQSESLLQFMNPFRLVLKLSYEPIRMGLFLGHLLSIAFTSDRVPGIADGVSRATSFFQELGTDVHYFFDAHHQADDIPSRLLKGCFLPLFALAALWDFICTRPGHEPASYQKSWQKFYAGAAETVAESQAQHAPLATLSEEWKQRQVQYRVQRFLAKHPGLPQEQKAQLARLCEPLPQNQSMQDRLAQEKTQREYHPRLFAKLQRVIAVDQPELLAKP
ncbi:MAG: hypothetical protein JJT82_01370 [Legionellaceae bacterium]|nr:hypothetical protein [Legionellaceae bacterium]